jgi:hypothetical protein
MYDPMDDLAIKLRTPVQANTHQEGWIRFELQHVKHELKDCRVSIHAIDIRGDSYEITTDDMQVKSMADHEYATDTTCVATCPARDPLSRPRPTWRPRASRAVFNKMVTV